VFRENKVQRQFRFLNKDEIWDIFKNLGQYLMILYRFIPFVRIPTMILCVNFPMKQMILFNLLGSFVCNGFFIIIGFLFFN
jgi:membrane protein DedA with SNARE-associated domain